MYNIEEKYLSGGSDTIEEIFEVTTERTGGFYKGKIGNILSSCDSTVN